MKANGVRYGYLFSAILLLPLPGCADSEGTVPEKFLLPAGYVGAFYVLYEIPGGSPDKYDSEGSRLYEIPHGGILLTQAGPNEGPRREDQVRFYYIDEAVLNSEITGRWTTSLHDTPENRRDTEVRVFGGSMGSIMALPGCDLTVSRFMVGTKSQVLDGEGFFDLYGERGLESVSQELLKEACEATP